ncbi:MAG TPA: hypothetical protein VJ725_15950 [Thermoanaerobaculia bacterium]|nr:hypothetical protein [Thermoanaerobaculia bacterium]
MKTPYLLQVEDSPETFRPLIDAARSQGMRVGWLELGASSAPVPESLGAAADSGVLRAVAVGEGRAVSVKPLRGAPVLKDLLREHFQGCVLVLVRGRLEGAPALTTDGDGWRISPPGLASRRSSTEDFIASLRKPNPSGS